LSCRIAFKTTHKDERPLRLNFSVFTFFQFPQIERTVLTMITRRKSSKLPPRSMLEVPNVLKGTSGQSTLRAVTQLEYKVAEKYDQEGDAAGNKDWGVSVVGNEGIPPALKKAMMSAVLSVDKVKLLATEGRNDDFFHEIFINRMSSINDARQQRQIDAPQHLWHTDGTVAHLTAVLTIYDSELDSNIRSAHDVGGFVKLSNFDDGRFTPTDSQRQNHPKPSSTTTYFPKTNSLYVFPGYFVAHAVFKVHPGTVRYSIVMFIRLRDSLIDGVTPDTYLRSEWASSNLDGKKEVCHRCWSAFGTQRQLADHQRRSIHCQNVNTS
jgi:hypothetical protein